MKVIIAGSRSIDDYGLVAECVRASGFQITQLVSGACPRGVDMLGEHWARLREIDIKRFPAPWRDKWGTFDSKAGFARNHEMSLYADALIAVWDGKSHGTENMIDCMLRRSLPVYVHNELNAAYFK